MHLFFGTLRTFSESWISYKFNIDYIWIVCLMSDDGKNSLVDGSELIDRDRDRYERQMMIDGFGEKGQEKLKSTTALVAGAGGLGSPVSIYLAAAGVGRIRIVDRDKVELNNLNRQILYYEGDIGESKASVSGKVLSRINGDIEVEPICRKIDDATVEDIVGGCDLIVDCLDNYETRYALNRAAVNKEIPFFHAAVEGMKGQATTIFPGETPCLKCIVPSSPPSQGNFPILGATAGMLACVQVREVIRHVVGLGARLKNKLLLIGENEDFEKVKVSKNPQCGVCGSKA